MIFLLTLEGVEGRESTRERERHIDRLPALHALTRD